MIRTCNRIPNCKLRSRLYASCVLLVCGVIVIGYFVLWGDRNFTVYNDNFKVLDYGISEGEDQTVNRGKVHKFYQGNATVGRVRAKLKHKFGLKFIRESPTYMAFTPSGGLRIFLLHYRGEFPFEELDDLRAVLTNGKEIFIELGAMKINALDENTLMRGYLLPVLPASNDSFRIDFKLKSADDPIASCRVGRLYRRNVGRNGEHHG